jgi:Zn-finger nucleic acid-binding protein
MAMDQGKEIPWVCDKCNKKLEPKKVKVRYLEGNFEVELMQCPQCKTVFVDEELALGKMLEVEKGLEDK